MRLKLPLKIEFDVKIKNNLSFRVCGSRFLIESQVDHETGRKVRGRRRREKSRINLIRRGRESREEKRGWGGGKSEKKHIALRSLQGVFPGKSLTQPNSSSEKVFEHEIQFQPSFAFFRVQEGLLSLYSHLSLALALSLSLFLPIFRSSP